MKVICLICIYLLPQVIGGSVHLQAQDLSALNTGAVVMYPKVSFDGTRIVFVANYDGTFKVYLSEKEADRWGQPRAVFGDGVYGVYDISCPQLSFDNSRLYFSARKRGADYNICFSDLKDDTWSEPQLLDVGINSDAEETAAAVSANGQIILFTRPMPADAKADPFCGQLYVTRLGENGSWSKPEPAGPEYTLGCEIAPYFGADNKTFYFSSYADIANDQGKRIAHNNFNFYWARIDGFYRFTPKAMEGLISDDVDHLSFSLDPGGVVYYGEGDIFGKNPHSAINSTLLPAPFRPDATTLIKGQIANLDGKPLEASVRLIDPYTTKILQEVRSGRDGYFQVFAPATGQFTVTVTREGYSRQLRVLSMDSLPELQADFSLFPDVRVGFNIFDSEFYFPIDATVSLYDAVFNEIKTVPVSAAGEENKVPISLGKQIFAIIRAENYLPDTLMLPFHEEMLFSEFDFDIELLRKIKRVDMNFTDENGNSLGLVITVHNVTRNEKTERQVKDGKIVLELRDGEVYEISTSAQGYSYFSARVDLTEKTTSDEVQVVKARLQSVENRSIVIENINFEYNSSNLTASSYGELDKLVDYLKQNAGYEIEVSGHTDASGADAYNLMLSQLRAGAVVAYLEDNGIATDRLMARGYGKTHPLYPNNSEENMAKNRRVEFKILNANARNE